MLYTMAIVITLNFFYPLCLHGMQAKELLIETEEDDFTIISDPSSEDSLSISPQSPQTLRNESQENTPSSPNNDIAVSQHGQEHIPIPANTIAAQIILNTAIASTKDQTSAQKLVHPHVHANVPPINSLKAITEHTQQSVITHSPIITQNNTPFRESLHLAAAQHPMKLIPNNQPPIKNPQSYKSPKYFPNSISITIAPTSPHSIKKEEFEHQAKCCFPNDYCSCIKKGCVIL